jgi:hypothetical protein
LLFSSSPKILYFAPIRSFRRSHPNRQPPQKTRQFHPDRQPPNCRRKVFELGLAISASPRRSPKSRKKFVSSDWSIAEFPVAYPFLVTTASLGSACGVAGNRLFTPRIQTQESPPNLGQIVGQFMVLTFPHRPDIARSRFNDQVIGTRADVRPEKYFVLFPKVPQSPFCAHMRLCARSLRGWAGFISEPLRLLILTFS